MKKKKQESRCPSYGIGYLENVKKGRQKLGEDAAHLWLSASLEGLRQESGEETREEYKVLFERQNLRIIRRAERGFHEALEMLDRLIDELQEAWGIGSNKR